MIYQIYNEKFWTRPENLSVTSIAVEKLKSFMKGERNIDETFDTEKMAAFFSNDAIKSAVISVMKLEKGFGLLKLGSIEATKYLGDGDTTFIEYIRDVIVRVLESKEA